MTTWWVVKLPHFDIWGIPKGKMGYDKRGYRASEQGYRGGFWGLKSREMGGWALAKHPKFVQKRKKQSIFCNFQGMQNGIIYWYKTWGKTHSNRCITITENTDIQHIALHLTPIPTMTSPPLQQIHYAMGKNLHLQLHSVFSFQFSVSFFAMSTTPKNWYTDFIIYI